MSFRYLLLSLIAVAVCVKAHADTRHNLFDPIYAFDDIDANPINSRPAESTTRIESRRPVGTVITQRRSNVDIQEGRPTFLDLSPMKSEETSIKRQTNIRDQGVDVSTRSAKRLNESPKHWSPLENYYDKLKLQFNSGVQQPIQQQPIQNGYSDKTIEDLIKSLKTGYSNPIAKSNFELPIAQGDFQNIQHILNRPTQEPNYYNFGSSYYAPAPGVSRKIIPSINNYNSGPIIEQQEHQIGEFDGLPGLIKLPQINKQTLPESQIENGRVKYFEWRQLPDLLNLQQDQQRAKHQEATLGSWLDQIQMKERVQDEGYCSPRNYVDIHFGSNTEVPESKPKGNQHVMDQMSLLLKLVQSNKLNGRLEIPIALSAGEYPSHMGIYNHSMLKDESFQCSATWIHEKFALTVASCVKHFEPTKLFVRSGEWNLFKNDTSHSLKSTMIERQVAKIHVFPKYSDSNQAEHNLALVEFDKPIDHWKTEYISPACSAQSRRSLRANACWSPVRNVTFVDYFDPEGEGETKERKLLSMSELPIKLIANDDIECNQQTKAEFFNFQHPNYICSPDYRPPSGRSRLNKTEHWGSGVYCNEGGYLTLVSMLHPMTQSTNPSYGYLDLSYYRPWIHKIVYGRPQNI